MYKQILVPYDGSAMAARILPKVEELAKWGNSHITLICVATGATDVVDPPSQEVFERAARHDLNACDRNMKDAVQRMQAKGLTVDSVCLEGDPAKAVIKYAQEHPIDLIALATHGRNEVSWMFGSTAEKIVSHATAPVLLIRVLEPHEQAQLREEWFMGA
jgi:nucleotide-binding universal stress UspA family protein